jgi:LysM repeat protein
MKFGILLTFVVVAAGLGVLGTSLPAHAAPPQQQFATNTPLPDGRITYTVQAGDTCTRIQLLYGISFEQLRELNQSVNADCTNIIEGQELLEGTGGPAGVTATPGPPPTPGEPTVTPTPFVGTTEICVLLFDDLNGDAMRQEDEPAIAGGAISVAETNGKYSKTLETSINADPTAYQGTCFSDVPEGTYNVGVAIPDNYNPTMNLTYTMEVKAGDRAFVDFGAQGRDAAVGQPPTAETGAGPSPALGFVGGVLLISGLGLGWYALRLRRPKGPIGGRLMRH